MQEKIDISLGAASGICMRQHMTDFIKMVDYQSSRHVKNEIMFNDSLNSVNLFITILMSLPQKTHHFLHVNV